MATARLMETWAHGQDVADALGVEPEPTDRLRHVAQIGVRTRDYAFARALPRRRRPRSSGSSCAAVRRAVGVGPGGGAAAVSGSGLDFCLLVTQRGHRADLALVAVGPDADRWLDIAQAFAGPPGTGRPRGSAVAT